MTRSKQDFYPTPIPTLHHMTRRVDWDQVSTFFEPCAGDGRILNEVPNHVRTSWCEISRGKDYFQFPTPNVDLIITNPPFSQWREFLSLSLTHARTVCYLLRLNVLGSGKKTQRAAFWNGAPPTYLFPLESRPSFVGTGTDSTDYAWFVWDSAKLIYPPRTGGWMEVLQDPKYELRISL